MKKNSFKILITFLFLIYIFHFPCFAFVEGEGELDQIETSTLQEKWDEVFKKKSENNNESKVAIAEGLVSVFTGLSGRFFLNSNLIEEAQVFFSKSNPTIKRIDEEVQQILNSVVSLGPISPDKNEALLLQKYEKLDSLLNEREKIIFNLVDHYERSVNLSGKPLSANEISKWKILKNNLKVNKWIGTAFLTVTSYALLDSIMRVAIVKGTGRAPGAFPVYKTAKVFTSYGMQFLQFQGIQ